MAQSLTKKYGLEGPALSSKPSSRKLQVELTAAQRRILEDMKHFRNETTAEYIQGAILGSLNADIDVYYKVGDPRRESAYKVIADVWDSEQ